MGGNNTLLGGLWQLGEKSRASSAAFFEKKFSLCALLPHAVGSRRMRRLSLPYARRRNILRNSASGLAAVLAYRFLKAAA
jgi:hypothetical protein